jgi:hypothetical protein
MPEPTPPRFRIRLDDGAELPVGSVEALARRVGRGDVAPATPLFDGSTGKWHAAAEAPVVQFILDELRREGKELPPEWSGPHEGLPEPPALPPVNALDESLEGEHDPLKLKLTPASQADEGGPALKNAYASPEGMILSQPQLPPLSTETGMDEAESARSFARRSSEQEWVTSPAEGGFFTPATARPTGLGVPETTSGVAARPSAPKPRPESTRRGTWLAVGVVGAAAVIGSIMLFGRGGSDAEISGPSPATPAQNVGPALAPPRGLEEAADRASALVERRLAAAVDSARAASSLGGAPPDAWLTGYYLANAAEFPDVRGYWERYAAMVEGLRILDGDLMADVIENQLGPSVVPENDYPRLVEYLERRYAASLPRRQEAFAHLSRVAAAATDLHDFLIAAGDAIQHTPALGAEAIPRDPVLEVGIDDPAVREGLEARLDALFDALDRSRGGGPPPQAGLDADLFGRFSAF